jgi:ribulose-5-phosphate 4-epimerase/fuculose-1-phosphate aldolase
MDPALTSTIIQSARDDARGQVQGSARHLAQAGLLVGTGGNVSVRIAGQEALAITPSGRDYLGMAVEDVCVVGWDGALLDGALAPSVETGMHTAVYRQREDAGAVIHTHQPFVSVLAILDVPIPALFDEQVMNLGIAVEVVPYAVSGSVTLLEHVAAHVDNGCNAFILQNHGALVLGTTVEDAVRNVELLEKAARVYVTALTTGRPITPLPAEMAEAIFELHRSEQRKAIRRLRRAARQE